MNDPLALQSVARAYRSGDEVLQVLSGADLVLAAGEIVALVAPSGTGKSTLLHLAGLLERPDSGAVLIDGRDSGQLPEAERTADLVQIEPHRAERTWSQRVSDLRHGDALPPQRPGRGRRAARAAGHTGGPVCQRLRGAGARGSLAPSRQRSDSGGASLARRGRRGDPRRPGRRSRRTVIVADASVAVLALLHDGEARRLVSVAHVAAPHLIDVEVTHAFRRRVQRQALDPRGAADMLEGWARLEVQRIRCSTSSRACRNCATT